MDAIVKDTPAVEAAAVPVVKTALDLTVGRHGLIVVDEVHGFCTVGRGALAPTVPNPQIDRMIAETERLARLIGPKLVFRDSHPPGQVEAPYPEHCVQGTGDDELVDALAFLNERSDTLVMPKDCISAVVGGMRPDGSNVVFEWAKRTGIDTVVVVGICTDICVLGVVLPLLSARTRGLLGDVENVVVHEPACATYDLPLTVARELGLPDTAAHPQDDFHRMGLLIMQNQGAIITG